jgi:hypothetical protein
MLKLVYLIVESEQGSRGAGEKISFSPGVFDRLHTLPVSLFGFVHG